MTLKLYASAIAATTELAKENTKAVGGMNDAIDSSSGLSTGFRKLLDFKDSKGERGGTTYAAAYDLLNRMLNQIERSNANPSNTALAIDTAQGETKLADYFRRVYPDVGDLRDLLKDLAEYRRREEQKAQRVEAGDDRLSKAIEKTVEKSTGPVSVRLGGYLLTLQESIRKLEAEREAMKREREAATNEKKTATRTPIAPAPAPTPTLAILRMSGGLP